MIISLAVFGREIFVFEIGRRVFLDDTPDADASVVLGTHTEFPADEGDFENHAYEEHPARYGFAPPGS